MRTRREVLSTLGAALPALAALAVTARGGERAPSLATAIAPGTRVGPCTVVRVEPLRDGAVPIVLASADGREATVEVMRYDADAPGIARAGSMGVYLSNGGDGNKPTDEAHGLGAIALAAEIARRERDGAVVPRLVSITARGKRPADRDRAIA